MDTPYSAGGTYQPGGTQILGIWRDGTLGITDANAVHVRPLAANRYSPSTTYVVTVGNAIWSHDGRRVFYEYHDGIWAVNADGSGGHQVIAGTKIESNLRVTVMLLPRLSPDDQMLLFVQVKGTNVVGGSVSIQCYLARADGSQITALPAGAKEAVWRPVK